ncbi:Chemotaxis phosphatase [gamma proteobacterium HdN1]|nr:Chemotaxis phosphatase [gamma proteobacterium HdN1]
MSIPDGTQFEGALVEQAKALLVQLESGDSHQAMKTISNLHTSRDQYLFQEVGKLTRSLHTAIQNFHVDSGFDASTLGEMSRMEDASERLNYVITLTERAANRTMDMVEETIPLSNSVGNRARELKPEWERLIRREMKPEEFRVLTHSVTSFLEQASKEASQIDDNLSNILLAQDYQDLTGQVIKKVITLVQEVQDNLVQLVKMAGSVDQIAGIEHAPFDPKPKENPVGAEGPIMNPEKRDDVVTGQDDVDALLSSLGF